MMPRRPLVEEIAWAIWRWWYGAWRWLLAMILAPFWAVSGARLLRAEQDRFAAQKALREAAYRHLNDVFLRIEDAIIDRSFLELDSPPAAAAADQALRAFLRHLVAIESGDFDAGPRPTRRLAGDESEESQAARVDEEAQVAD